MCELKEAVVGAGGGVLFKAPRLMCTQHPDSTVRVGVEGEVFETIQSFMVYGCDEVMVDYEGKLTPYTQPASIVVEASRHGLALGEGLYVTPRVSNPELEGFDRLLLSLEAAVSANYHSYRLLGTQAVRWVVLPMVESRDTIMLVQRLLSRKVEVLREELGVDCEPIQLVPLIEDTGGFRLAADYVQAVAGALDVETLRVFLGKSDAAVRSGHIASALALVYAMSRVKSLEGKLGRRVEVIIGMGSPPFRGGINNPRLVGYEVRQYGGYSTATIQSAIRYDVPFEEYQRVSSLILEGVGSKPARVDSSVLELVERAEIAYRSLVERYLEKVVSLARQIPQTRDRIVWEAYGRQLVVGGRTYRVPRAIVYTATWYTLGLPPAMLDADFIIHLYERGELDTLLEHMPFLVEEWRYESQFYNPKVVAKRLGESLAERVNKALDILGVKPERNEAYQTLLELNPIEPHIATLGRLRGFLG